MLLCLGASLRPRITQRFNFIKSLTGISSQIQVSPSNHRVRWEVRGWSQPGKHRLNRLIGRAAAAAEAPKPGCQGAVRFSRGTGFDGAGVAAAAGNLQRGPPAMLCNATSGGELATRASHFTVMHDNNCKHESQFKGPTG